MAIDDGTLAHSVDLVARIPPVEMDPQALVDDVVLIAYAYPDEDEFKAAIASVCRALSQLVDGRVSGSELQYNHTGWLSYHFQHRRSQGAKADMRVVYQKGHRGIRVRGFGNRRIPTDIYRRLHSGR